jgi:phosphoribosylformimino-5-aminoimidazole carboxamide ribonucleotide (ProFAR) isomerase
MPFTLLPAVDVTGGRLGAYRPEGPEPVDAFGGDPVEAARSAARAGARWLHVVDMDLAFGGEVRNADVVAAVAALEGIRVQASGGIRTWEEARAYLDAGASRVVLGSAALSDEGEAGHLLARLGPAVVVGIEVEDGRIRSRGAGRVDLDLMSTIGWLHAAGAPGFLVTAVSRVGGLGGPDVALVRRVARRGRPTFAAGGIRSLEDLEALRDAGAAGAVVGRASVEGGLDLGAAIAWASV